MTRLEERYRSLLRLLPASYRQEWEDDMVAAFLESVDAGDPDATEYAADYGRPTMAETASVLALAIRLRIGGPAPRRLAMGQAVRLAVLTATLLNAVLATAGIAITAWLSGRLSWLPAPPADLVLGSRADTWHTAWGLAGYAWLPAYVALVLGYRRAAQAVAALAAGTALISTAVAQFSSDGPLSVTAWVLCLFEILLVVGMTAFRDGTPAVPRRPWLYAVPVGVMLVPVPLLTLAATTPAFAMVDLPALACFLVTAAMLVHLIGRSLGWVGPALPWSLALVLLATAAGGLRLLSLADYHHQVQRSAFLAIGAAQLLAVVAVGVPLAVAANRLKGV